MVEAVFGEFNVLLSDSGKITTLEKILANQPFSIFIAASLQGAHVTLQPIPLWAAGIAISDSRCFHLVTPFSNILILNRFTLPVLGGVGQTSIRWDQVLKDVLGFLGLCKAFTDLFLMNLIPGTILVRLLYSDQNSKKTFWLYWLFKSGRDLVRLIGYSYLGGWLSSFILFKPGLTLKVVSSVMSHSQSCIRVLAFPLDF